MQTSVYSGPSDSQARSPCLSWDLLLAECPQCVRGRGLFKIIAHVLSWMFVIGMAICAVLVIPITAYRLFSVLFEKDRADEINPRQ